MTVHFPQGITLKEIREREKVMNYLTIEEKTLQKLQTFSTVAEMNQAVIAHKVRYNLGKTDRAILDAISRYACKYTGVCYLRKQSLAEAAGFVSRRTAIRSCHRLEKLGIIKQYETRRITGDRRQAANIIVIQPSEKNKQHKYSTKNQPGGNKSTRAIKQSHGKETVHKSKDELTKTTHEHTDRLKHTDEINCFNNESYQRVTANGHSKKHSNKTSIKLKHIETYIETDALFKRGLKRSIPEQIYEAFAPFFDGQTLYEVYGILLRAKAKIDSHIIIEHYVNCYIDAFYNVIRLYKRRKVKCLAGYLYVTWERLSAEISRQEASEIYSFNDFAMY